MKVLIVDDCQDFRRLLRLTSEKRTTLTIVGEALVTVLMPSKLRKDWART